MNKKFFVIVFVLIILCVSAQAARRYDIERGNDKKHLDAARQISAIEGVNSAAVLSHQGRVLAGITLLPESDKFFVGEWVDTILKTTFPKAGDFVVFIEDQNAKSVVELSFCIDTDMNKKLLKQRFDFLMEQNI